MAGDGFDVTDLFVLARSYEAKAGVLPGEVQLAVTETLADIVTDAKGLTPVDTGANRESIDYDVHYTATGAYGAVGPTTHYGGYLELGTSRMGPRPYLFPAADKHLPAFTARLGQALT